jgi:alkylhydroperoxidase family enzyme
MTATASSPSISAGLAACARQFDEQELAALVLAIANINVWNRLNVAIRQPVGAWKV